MLLVTLFLMRLVEVGFFAGIVGSSIVVMISSFEDIHELQGE